MPGAAGAAPVPRPARHAGASAPDVIQGGAGETSSWPPPMPPLAGCRVRRSGRLSARMRGAGSLRRLGGRCRDPPRWDDEGDERPAARPLGPAGRRRIGAGHPCGCIGATLRPAGVFAPEEMEGKAVRGSKSAGGAVPLVQLTWGRRPLLSSMQRRGGADAPWGGWKGERPGAGCRRPCAAGAGRRASTRHRWRPCSASPASILPPPAVFASCLQGAWGCGGPAGGGAGACGRCPAGSQAQQGFGGNALNFVRLSCEHGRGCHRPSPRAWRGRNGFSCVALAWPYAGGCRDERVAPIAPPPLPAEGKAAAAGRGQGHGANGGQAGSAP